MIKRSCKKTIKYVTAFLISFSILIQPSNLYVYAEGEENKEPQIMVSLGDSYSSGEGIEPFFGQSSTISKKVHNPDWLAHRSQNCWSGMLTLPGNEGTMADNKGTYWFFEAASGAVTDNLKYAFTKEYNKGIYEGRYNLSPQLAIFDELGENEVDYVTMTMGGNDVGFVDIITSCAVGSKFLNIGGLTDRLNNTWDIFYANGGTQDRLKDAYTSIAEKAGTQAQIIIAGYPKLLDKNGKGFLISKAEAKEVNANIIKFNNALERIVNSYKESGMNISFVSVEEAFDGHGAYSDDAYINSIIYLAKSEDLKNTPPSAYSIHPNKNGAKAYASCVQAKIDEIEENKKIADTLNKDSDLSNNPEATDEEIRAKAKHFSGVIFKPEDVVLKMFDALQDGDYELAAECMDPATEQQLDFWGGIASKLVGLFTGEYISWGQLVLEAAGATEVDVIECYSDNLVMESNSDLFSEWLPKIPGLRNLVCTEADVIVKYRYKFNAEYYTEEETFHVRRYEWSGWRIEQ